MARAPEVAGTWKSCRFERSLPLASWDHHLNSEDAAKALKTRSTDWAGACEAKDFLEEVPLPAQLW
ncbi:hypothetical protein DYH09_23885 [bacterium CPR1]|nr:hypothetical protein [bacterium CPR1]